MTAQVTSDGVGLVEKASVDKTVFSAKSVLLDISRSRGFFKPGLPFDLEVFVLQDPPTVIRRFCVDLLYHSHFRHTMTSIS